MIVAQPEAHVLNSSGLEETRQFKIKTSAHAFKILSSGLYSDKITAVLREIGCNAYDAHQSVGKASIPFEVKLPNQIDPEFYIKDFGPGLSHEDVMELYTTYFHSTKQASNDFTGAFGLGSKSPFSYTDSFAITSCYGGYSRIYTAYIGDDGSPSISLLSTLPSDETGIKIGFSVKYTDIREFAAKAQNVYEVFKTPPTILGGQQIKPLIYSLDKQSWAIKESVDYSRRSSEVVMGNVRYLLSHDYVNINNLVLRFDIGELQVAASREELQYDKQTVEAIENRVREVAKHFIQELETAWNIAKTGTWLQKCEFAEIATKSKNSFNFDKKAYNNDALYDAVYSRYFSRKLIPDDKVNCVELKGTNRIIQDKIKDQLSLYYNKELCIVSGVATYSSSRIREAMKSGKLKEVIHVFPNKKNGGTALDVENHVKQLETLLGGIEKKNNADLDKPLRIITKRSKGLPIFDVEIDGVKMPVTSVPVEQRVYARQTIRHNWGNRSTIFWLKDKQLRHYNLAAFTTCIKNLKPIFGFINPVLITSKEVNRFKKHGWKEYGKYLEEKLLNKANIALLQTAIGNQQPQITNMFLIQLKEFKKRTPDEYKKIQPVLGELDKILVDTPVQIIKPLDNYKELAGYLNCTVPDLALKKQKYNYNITNVTYGTLESLAKNAPKTFPKLIKELIK